jgi:penicillin amidase
VSLDRLLKYINLIIAAAVVAILALGYWFVWRPLPRTSGELKAPVSSQVTIARDALGVPHIRASSIEDALFAQGFATAQDRFWQMDALRRRAAGELAEVAGEAAIESDREARRLRLARIAAEQTAALAPADRQALAAYARGVNYYIESQQGRLPLEFSVMRYDPRPWRLADSVLAGLEMFRTLTTSWKTEIQKQTLLTGGDKAKVEFLFPVRSGGELLPGSNTWVISGARTATGKPMLANDMHLTLTIPSVWHMVHLEAPGLNVAGVALPGLPGVVVGHNDRIAWGITNLEFDVQDLYAEKLNPQTGRYIFEGREEQARLEREKLPVKGRAPEEFNNIVTRHGPVVAIENGTALALRWTAAEPGKFHVPLIDIDRATNWQEFRAALSTFPIGLNFAYADADGNIGYQVTGLLPVRKNCAGDVPADGSTATCEWDGFIPFDELPSQLNPPSGMFVSANQNPFPTDYRYHVSGGFDPGYRSRQIAHLLSARTGWRARDMLEVQKDVYSAFSTFLARQAVTAYDARGRDNKFLREPAEILRAWNGQMEQNLAAPMVASLLYQHLRRRVVERAAPGKALVYRSAMAPAVIEKLLRERPKDWFDDYDGLLLKAFDDAMEEGRRLQGDKIAKWSYGQYNRLRIAHPVGGRLPSVGKYFNIGPVENNGSSTTVKAAGSTFGPSMRMVADASSWENSLLNLPTGQSGHVLSSHYKDQWDAYYAGRSFPMQFRGFQAKDVLILTPR